MKKVILVLITFFVLIGCSDDDGNHPCYDSTLVHKNPCTADCPGILGCDGNTYCNECVAASLGIRPK